MGTFAPRPLVDSASSSLAFLWPELLLSVPKVHPSVLDWVFNDDKTLDPRNCPRKVTIEARSAGHVAAGWVHLASTKNSPAHPAAKSGLNLLLPLPRHGPLL